ncbi:MAG: PQQ-binding-like beta-propeller repeat protein, partial [Chitinophagaceae bacterium]
MIACSARPFRLFALFLTLVVSCKNKNDFGGWEQYNGSNEGIHYSSLTQVDTNNVKELKPAWEYHTLDADSSSHSQIQCNPIVVNEVLYAVSPKLKLFALAASTGKEQWHFDPFKNDKKKSNNLNSCRGVTWFEDGSGNQRIFFTAGSSLFSIDAKTGMPDSSFGKGGKVDLHEGLGRDVANLYVTSTSPGIIYKDLLVVGTRVNEANPAAPGHVRAYDTKTGEIRWIFHTIPQPGEKGYETWDDPLAYTFTGGANVWSGFSLDEKRKLLFACTGSASFDFYGGKRKGNNLFANCVLALDAETGKLKWHYQVIHHDVWDRDIPSAPVLISIDANGTKKDAVAITTKHGFVFVLDRETGKPVYQIDEAPVPAVSDLQGEKLSPTQPIPSKPAPFIRQLFTEKDINPLLGETDQAEIKSRWAGYLKDNMWTPASLQGTIFLPGLDGGAEWG